MSKGFNIDPYILSVDNGDQNLVSDFRDRKDAMDAFKAAVARDDTFSATLWSPRGKKLGDFQKDR